MKQNLWKLYGNPHLWYIIYPVKCYIASMPMQLNLTNKNMYTYGCFAIVRIQNQSFRTKQIQIEL